MASSAASISAAFSAILRGDRGLVRLRAGRPVPFPREGAASFIGSPFHERGVAAGGSDTAVVDLIRGYVCGRGFHFFYVLLISS